jgi:hypothetical protein
MKLSACLLIAALGSTITLATAHEVEVGGFNHQQKTSGPDEQVAEGEIPGIAMRCVSGEGGHRIAVLASNSGNARKLCQSRCYYRTSSGLNGVLYASGMVLPGAKDSELRTDYFGGFTVDIANAGSFACR